jgi:dihydroorotate dehydrogenase electron transfer subunit
MKQSFFEIISNTPLTSDVFKMELKGDTSDITACGQFVNVKLDGMYLRRPISVNDVTGDILTIIYKVVGKGTEYMSLLTSGKLDIK